MRLDERGRQYDKFEASVWMLAVSKSSWRSGAKRLTLKEGEVRASKTTNTELQVPSTAVTGRAALLTR